MVRNIQCAVIGRDTLCNCSVLARLRCEAWRHTLSHTNIFTSCHTHKHACSHTQIYERLKHINAVTHTRTHTQTHTPCVSQACLTSSRICHHCTGPFTIGVPGSALPDSVESGGGNGFHRLVAQHTLFFQSRQSIHPSAVRPQLPLNHPWGFFPRQVSGSETMMSCQRRREDVSHELF